MRTNIDIDDALMAKALRHSDHATKKQVVHEALQALIRLKRQAEICKSFGQIPWEGDLDDMRTSKYSDWDRVDDAA